VEVVTTVVVSGSTGRIGRRVVRMLERRPGIDAVTALDLGGSIHVFSLCADPIVELTLQAIDSLAEFIGCVITAGPDFDILDGADVTFRAGELIVLRNGFSVHEGADFTTIIDPSLYRASPAEQPQAER